MRSGDLIRLAITTLWAYRLRSVLSMAGVAIGIAAVILLTSIGEGTRRFVLDEFTQFGTNLIAVNPGKSETTGVPLALAGTTRDLTIEDAEALRRLPGVEAVVPMALGSARVEHRNRGRDVFIYGVTQDVPRAWQFEIRQGRFLPGGDPRRGSPVVVMGPKLKHELFGDDRAIGERVRIGGRSFRVIGILTSKGQFLGFDLDDSAYIPVAVAQALFNRRDLMEIDILYASSRTSAAMADDVRRVLMERHDDKEDFTITTQDSMLELLNRVLGVVTVAVGAIGGISLLVGAIGILTMMWIAVNQRSSEIGLLRALGARRGQILGFFLVEASLLSTVGGVIGVAAGMGGALILRALLPGLPVHTPMGYVVAAVMLSLVVGLASSVLPARRAAGFDPVEALRAE
ncbi:MAG: ABC transporter permease [Acidobacteria bacterium]|nr:ABC transporter permease [Acidobacteriota bacterium]